MRKSRKFISILLTALMFVSVVSVSANAATTINYAPYPKVEYNYSSGVKVGTIRYISQNSKTAYFNWSYWPLANFGEYYGPGSECGTASISMALSYIGINKMPKDILHPTSNGITYWGGWGADILYPSLSNAIANYNNGNGKYSPPIVHFTHGYSSGSHYVLLIAQTASTSYLVLDPAELNTWILSTNDAKYKSINEVIQYYNPNASISSDTQKPTISNVKISNITSSGYTVTCTVTDNIGVTKVTFPTWTEYNGQDDLLWKNGTISGNTVTFNVNASDHNNESGYYATHIYAYDAAGNEAVYHCLSTNVPSAHSHSYTSTITTAPTCKNEGVRTYKCSCGASYTEKIAKHPATHAGGTEIRNVRASTCKDTGYSGDTYCKGCGVCLGFGTSTAKNKNNHAGGTTIKNTKEPTCTVEGYSGDTFCKGCDTKLSTGNIIGKIPHNYESYRIEPKCTQTGLITYTCYCGDTYDEIIPATGHADSGWIIYKKSTCTSAGSKYKECLTCEELLDIEVIPVAPHNYEIIIVEATCETDGYTTYNCADCGDNYIADEISAYGHNDEDGNSICDLCGIELICKHCGRPVHREPINEYICIITMFIKLLVAFINAVS